MVPWYAWLLLGWLVAVLLFLVWNAGAHAAPTPGSDRWLRQRWGRTLPPDDDDGG